jgi:uncharacterized protein
MLIAVLSDAHDNIWNVEKALPRVANAEALIFCGDFCAPFTLKMLADGFNGPVHCVLGNNDGDALLLGRIAAGAENVALVQGTGRVSYGDRQIAFAHYPEIGRALAASGAYDGVFSGHTHRPKIEQVGKTIWVNPGEMMGRYGEPSYALYDTQAGTVEIVRL